MRRLSLTGTFAVVSLTAMTAVALVLVWVVNVTVRSQALDDSRTLASSFTSLGIKQVLATPDTWPERGPVALGAQRAILEQVRLNGNGAVSGVNLFALDGRPVGTSEPRLSDVLPPTPGLFDQAVRGAIMSTVEPSPGGDTLAVYVPVTYDDSTVRGIAEIELPYSPVEERVRVAVVAATVVIVLALLAVWLLLFRTVHRASRRLREQAAENERLALHDALTGLPNRRLLSDRLERAVAARERTGDHIALMFLDVDRFKEVNDTLGHDRGDELLRQVAERLCDLVRDGDTVSRLGGDEFAVLAPSLAGVEDAERLARRVREAFETPFTVDGLVLHVESSIGVAVVPDHADDATQVMQRADVAMYGAKVAHLGVLTYDQTEDGSSADRLILLGDLKAAIGTHQLSVHFQPVVDLHSMEVITLEALLRWQHPERGNIPPIEFIPLAERTGLIHALTRYVLEMVLRQMAEWGRVRPEFADLPVAVNISPRNLTEPSFADFVEDLLAGYDLAASRLEMEITETALTDDPARTHEMLRRLSALGIKLAVDDFGTGYTSMSQLGRMPLRTLKIDRSYVVRMMQDQGGETLVKAFIDVAHEFGLEVVAEGVEDDDVTTRLVSLGCDMGQGYLWSRPVPSDELPAVMERLAALRPVGSSVRS